MNTPNKRCDVSGHGRLGDGKCEDCGLRLSPSNAEKELEHYLETLPDELAKRINAVIAEYRGRP
jgi:hypothetical protein